MLGHALIGPAIALMGLRVYCDIPSENLLGDGMCSKLELAHCIGTS